MPCGVSALKKKTQHGVGADCAPDAKRTLSRVSLHTQGASASLILPRGALLLPLLQTAALDWAVGETVDGLKDAGLYNDTIIVYTSGA